jgi:hypothetical protein
MMMAVPAEQEERTPIRIFRGSADPRRGTVFQPEWAPLHWPDASPDSGRVDGHDRVRRNPARRFDLAQSVALSVCVSAFVTLVLTVRSVGLAPDLTQTWLATLKLSLLIGLPARFLIEPYVERLVGFFLEPPRS